MSKFGIIVETMIDIRAAWFCQVNLYRAALTMFISAEKVEKFC